MSKAQKDFEEKTTKMMEARYALRIEMLEKMLEAVTQDNNALAAENASLKAQRDKNWGRDVDLD